MHRDPRDLEVAEVGQCVGDRPRRRSAHCSADHDDLGSNELRLNHFAQTRRLALGESDPVHVRTSITCGGGERVAVHVVDLAGARSAVDVDEFAAHRDHREPRFGMNQHARLTDRGEQPDLSRTDDRSGTNRDITGLHVVADSSNVITTVDAVPDLDLLIAAVGPAEGHHGVGERRHRGARLDAYRLPRLKPGRGTRTRRDLADHGKRHDHRLTGLEIDQFGTAGVEFLELVGIARCRRSGERNVDGPHGVAVDRGLVETGHWSLGDDLLGAHQTLRLGNCHPYRPRSHRRSGHQRQMIFDRPHLTSSPRRTHVRQ
ncbi:Uncharacterised protein [Mycobacteroides abscessus subsp. abscessus]|nr:Uncharacterised protein [Mycobacteroides abscessus subsp. abscessus]